MWCGDVGGLGVELDGKDEGDGEGNADCGWIRIE